MSFRERSYGLLGIWLGLVACGGAAPAPTAEPDPVGFARVAPKALVPGPDLVGVCDASAAVAVGSRVIVADDEHNVLRIYDLAADGAPNGTITLAPLSPLLAGKESDLEGMATADDGTVWVTASHDSGKGNTRLPERQRLFGLQLAVGADRLEAKMAHGPATSLIEKGQQKNALYGIVANTVGKTSKDPMGLSIEGLAKGPNGTLLVGFRAPIHDGMALVERLDNPVAMAAGEDPAFTGPRWLNLGGRGVRSLEADGDGFLVVAGPATGGEEGETFALYRWGGFDDGSDPVEVPIDFGDLNPEGLVKVGNDWWLLSDDGNRKLNGETCKDLPEDKRRARTARLP